MAFLFKSELPSSTSSDWDKVTSFQCDVNTIKKYLTEIGNNYLLIAYRVYEMSWSENYKPWYKNIAEACEAALGFKKSTTYNLISIIKRFGTPEPGGYIPYNSIFGVNQYSYSQLTEMLSMSNKQLEKVTPEMSVREIKQIKKAADVDISAAETSEDNNQAVVSESFQTSGMSNDSKTETFQTFGKTKIDLLPCPFCGDSASFVDINTSNCSTLYYVQCNYCFARIVSCSDKDSAAAVWNKRT